MPCTAVWLVPSSTKPATVELAKRRRTPSVDAGTAAVTTPPDDWSAVLTGTTQGKLSVAAVALGPITTILVPGGGPPLIAFTTEIALATVLSMHTPAAAPPALPLPVPAASLPLTGST